MTFPDPSSPVQERKRRWHQYSLRTLLVAVTVASGWLSWQTYRVEQQASAVAALQELGGQVTSKARNPEWLWNLLGKRLGQKVICVGLDCDKAEAAIPHLKALPDLEEVDVWWHQLPHGDRDADERKSLLVQQSLPGVEVRSFAPFDDPIAMLAPFITPEPWVENPPTTNVRQGSASRSQLR